MTDAQPLDDGVHFDRLIATYLSSPTNDMYAPRMRIQQGEASVEIDVKESLFHAAQAVHGSHYFKLLDDSAFFAVNSLVRDVFVLTVSYTTNFLRPVSSGIMRAEGRVVNASKRLYWAESILYDGQGRELGRGSGTFIKSRIALDEKIGYR